MSEKSGGPVSYYLVQVSNPNQGTEPYQAECGDIIEALGMDFNEGCEFKALWRSAAARTLGKMKSGGDAVYDSEKRVFYAQRSLSMLRHKQDLEPITTPEQDAFIAQVDAKNELSPSSVAMNAARRGGICDSVCHYLAFPNNVCNKCGKAHDGIVTSFPPLDRDEEND